MSLIDEFRKKLSLLRFDEAEDLLKAIKRSEVSGVMKSRVEIEYFLATEQFQYAALLVKKILEKIKGSANFSFLCLMLRCMYLAKKSEEARLLVKSCLSSSIYKSKDMLVLLSIMVEFDDEHVVEFIRTLDLGVKFDGEGSGFVGDRPALCSDQIERAFEGPQRFIFVGGTPRSGTSALGVFLNQHHDVAMTVERYGYTQGFHPNMFALEQFCRENSKGDNEQFRFKATTSTFLGDKRPNFLFGWFLTKENFSPEEIRIIHLIRDPYLVAESYNKRARLQAEGRGSWGSWPYSPRNQVYAVRDINVNNKYVDQIKNDSRFRRSLLVADSSEVYSSESNLIEIVDWLGLPVTNDIKLKAKAVVEKSKQYKAKEQFSVDTYEYVNKTLDWCLFDSVVGRRDL